MKVSFKKLGDVMSKYDPNTEYQTRSGLKVSQLTFFEGAKGQYCIAGIVHYDSGGALLETWSSDLHHASSCESDLDLIPIPKTVKRWHNVYASDFVMGPFKSEEEALRKRHETSGICVTKEVEWELPQ